MTRRVVDLGLGVPVTVVSQEEAERAEVLICTRWSTPAVFMDDQQRTCAICFQAVRVRPTSPKAPRPVCMDCLTASGGMDEIRAALKRRAS